MTVPHTKKNSSKCPQTQKRKWACGHFELCPWCAALGVISNFLLLSEALHMSHAASLGWLLWWQSYQCTATIWNDFWIVKNHTYIYVQLLEHEVSKPHFCLPSQPVRRNVTRKCSRDMRYTSSTMSPAEEMVSTCFFLCAKIKNIQNQISIWKNTLKLRGEGTVPPCELASF